MDPDAPDCLWRAIDRESHDMILKDGTRRYINSHISGASVELGEKLNSLLPTRSLAGCKSCKEQLLYKTPGRLYRHLKRRHFNSESNQVTQDAQFLPWMINEARWANEEKLRCLDILLFTTAGTLDQIYQDLLHMKHGVCTRDGTRHEKCMLRRKLLEAFVQIIGFFMCLENAANIIKVRFETPKTLLPVLDDVAQVLLAVTIFGRRTLEEIKNARQQLCRMIREGGGSKARESKAYGPDIVLGCIARQLFQRRVVENARASQLYSLAFDKIRFQVNHRPNKKLLRYLVQIQEELDALSQVNRWQWRAINKHRMLCDDDTFYRSDGRRKKENIYQRWMTKQTETMLHLEEKDYREMIDMCHPLADLTKQSVEVNEEDHGKLIFAFTTVTVIFLPLSFITSYFGMNTVDIRDTTARQNMFWAIALPVTVIVVAVTVAITSREDAMYGFIMDVFRRDVSGKTRRERVPVADRLEQLGRQIQHRRQRSPKADGTIVVLEEPEFRAQGQRNAVQPSNDPEFNSRSLNPTRIFPEEDSTGSFISDYIQDQVQISEAAGISDFQQLSAMERGRARAAGDNYVTTEGLERIDEQTVIKGS
ncbi:hypothetical protein EDB80DRAFT_382212 [Ilyonectria destructans]|nr:hypothetical protein EDB80DRAFT_382212 [Ilyonectria destructans]